MCLSSVSSVRQIDTQLLAETNPVVLVITMIVSLLHSVFNFLAFKNDISFWKDKKRYSIIVLVGHATISLLMHHVCRYIWGRTLRYMQKVYAGQVLLESRTIDQSTMCVDTSAAEF